MPQGVGSDCATPRCFEIRYDDLTDTASMALNYLRSVGEARTDVEVKADEIGTVMHKPRLPALYPC